MWEIMQSVAEQGGEATRAWDDNDMQAQAAMPHERAGIALRAADLLMSSAALPPRRKMAVGSRAVHCVYQETRTGSGMESARLLNRLTRPAAHGRADAQVRMCGCQQPAGI